MNDRLLLFVLVALLAAMPVGCSRTPSGPDDAEDVEQTQQALTATRPQVEALEGVVDADLTMAEELEMPLPTILRARLTTDTDDEAAIGRAMRRTAELIWRSDVPEVGIITVTAATPSNVLVQHVDGIWPSTASAEELEAMFGPRDPAG